MKIKRILLLTFFSLLLFSCDKPPEACMELSQESVGAGTPIEFVSCSEHALSWEWFIEGPDGAPENDLGWSDESFSRAFSVPGSYTVTLNAYEEFSFLGRVSTTTTTFIIG